MFALNAQTDLNTQTLAGLRAGSRGTSASARRETHSLLLQNKSQSAHFMQKVLVM